MLRLSEKQLKYVANYYPQAAKSLSYIADDVIWKHVRSHFHTSFYMSHLTLRNDAKVISLTSVRRSLRVIIVDHRPRGERQNRKTRDNGRGQFHVRLIFVSRDISRTSSIHLPFARIQYAYRTSTHLRRQRVRCRIDEENQRYRKEKREETQGHDV